MSGERTREQSPVEGPVDPRSASDVFVGQKFLSSGESERRTKKFPFGRCFLHLCISNERDPILRKQSKPEEPK